MTLPVVWLPEAAADLDEARTWYDAIHPDLGVRFAFAVDAAVDAIAQGPLRFQVLHKEIRRAGIKRFPYGIFIKLETHRIVVIACMHGRRNPRRWKIRA